MERLSASNASGNYVSKSLIFQLQNQDHTSISKLLYNCYIVVVYIPGEVYAKGFKGLLCGSHPFGRATVTSNLPHPHFKASSTGPTLRYDWPTYAISLPYIYAKDMAVILQGTTDARGPIALFMPMS